MRFLRPIILAIAIVASLAVPSLARPVMVYAAASTTDAILDINAAFEKSRAGKSLSAFGSTGMLAYQIEYGAPADVLVSANAKWLDHLARRGFLATGTRSAVAENTLVLIKPHDSRLALAIEPDFPLAAALKDGRLAIADPAHSPAGAYAKAALKYLGVWDGLARRTARAANVRQALVLVERGQAAAGIVYATDARASNHVRIVGVFPPRSYPAIRYEAALIKGRATKQARAYLALLKSATGQAIFRRHRFGSD